MHLWHQPRPDRPTPQRAVRRLWCGPGLPPRRQWVQAALGCQRWRCAL